MHHFKCKCLKKDWKLCLFNHWSHLLCPVNCCKLIQLCSGHLLNMTPLFKAEIPQTSESRPPESEADVLLCMMCVCICNVCMMCVCICNVCIMCIWAVASCLSVCAGGISLWSQSQGFSLWPSRWSSPTSPTSQRSTRGAQPTDW